MLHEDFVVRMRGKGQEVWHYITEVRCPFSDDKRATRHATRPQTAMAKRMKEEEADLWLRKTKFGYPWIEVEKVCCLDLTPAQLLLDDPMADLEAV